MKLVREWERSLAAACERGRFRVVLYSIQNDHVHLIVEASSNRDLASGMKSIGARLARAVNRVFSRRGCVLWDRYHRHVLRTPREVLNAIAYVLLNARRHLAKTGRRPLPRPAIDPASSGRWFSGWNRTFQPASSLDPPLIAPRTRGFSALAGVVTPEVGSTMSGMEHHFDPEAVKAAIEAK